VIRRRDDLGAQLERMIERGYRLGVRAERIAAAEDLRRRAERVRSKVSGAMAADLRIITAVATTEDCARFVMNRKGFPR
jgi:hypothetical protein